MARTIDLVVVHSSATPADMDIGAATIRRWHMSPDPNDPSKPWSDIGYHFFLRRDGEIEFGRPVERQGAHVAGHNETSIGVCLVGGTNANERAKAEFNFTMAQMAQLAYLLHKLGERYPEARVCGHRDLDPHKACPAFNVTAWWGGENLARPRAGEPLHRFSETLT